MKKHRKLFAKINGTDDYPFGEFFYPQPPPPPSPSSLAVTDQNDDESHVVSPFVVVLFTLLASFLLLLLYYVVVSKSCFGLLFRSRRRRSNYDDDEDHLAAESDGGDQREQFVDHHQNPIWLIATVGLQQPIINSITVVKYRKGEGLIDGTECSVCLSEFREHQTLRLLPKCSHAFHVPCIDTWLRSHTNCPLCRAHIVTDPNSNSNGSVIISGGSSGISADQNAVVVVERDVGADADAGADADEDVNHFQGNDVVRWGFRQSASTGNFGRLREEKFARNMVRVSPVVTKKKRSLSCLF